MSQFEIYIERRQKLLRTIGEGIAIIPTSPEFFRNRDTQFPFRADSYFWYLTAFPEPESILVLLGATDKSPAKSILFCREKNPAREVWDGFRYGVTEAAAHFCFDEAYAIDEFSGRFPEMLQKRETLWVSMGYEEKLDAKINAAMAQLRSESRALQLAPTKFIDVRCAIDKMRLIKDAHEISLLKKAAKIGSAAHQRAMKMCKVGLPEYSLEAELIHEFRQSGATGHSFLPIVAGGKNACTLHYIENNQRLNDGDLVLVDAGCEVDNYASDITRTYPVNGKFSAVQKEVYEIVLAAQSAAISAILPNASFNDYHEKALKILVQGMMDLRLLQGGIDEIIEKETYKDFYMHRAGHWLGLDVHDAGAYKSAHQNIEEWIKLKPNMTLTVEPGLYISANNLNVPEHLRGIGIRIEDDVLVTANGCEVYTDAPKKIREIEDWMRG